MVATVADLRTVEVGSGRVTCHEQDVTFALAPQATGYSNAQLDDYGGRLRRAYRWRAGTEMRLAARFSTQQPVGTAGFGFWNAPFGDRQGGRPTLPQAVWFFYASPPSNLPLAPHDERGQGWFAATLDATTSRALLMAPVALPVMLLNQIAQLRRRLWPVVQRRLGIQFARCPNRLDEWATYTISWQRNHTRLSVNGRPLIDSAWQPRGPLAFVAWIDNQYLIATARGRFAGGSLPVAAAQSLELKDIQLQQAE